MFTLGDIVGRLAGQPKQSCVEVLVLAPQLDPGFRLASKFQPIVLLEHC